MPSPLRTLLALAFLARPLAAQEPPFSTEVAIGFGYEGSATERPRVVLDGLPSDAYAYSADGRAYAVDVAATRWLGPVADDGKTPFALLPYVARASSVSARFALAATDRDSLGRFEGREASLEASFSGDGSVRDAGLSAEWFLGRSVSVRGGFDSRVERETAASTSIESPSGRADVSTSGTRGSSASGSLGVALRLGEHEVSVLGRYGEADRTRDDASAFTGGAQPFLSTIETEGIVREAAVAARLLLLDRRLSVDAAGRYASESSSSDLSSAISGPFSKAGATGRRATVEATWWATRGLGLSLGSGVETREVSSGAPGRERPSSEATAWTLRASVRWFASPRVRVVLSGERVETETVAPPGSTTYQEFEETTGRVVLGAALRL
jgi:hypothetical protein